MKPLLKLSQKYAALIAVIIIFAILAALSGDGGLDQVDAAFGTIVGVMAGILFTSLPEALATTWWFFQQIPLVVLVLIGAAVFFTIRFDFVNLRGLRHAFDVVRGRYDDPNTPGEVSHFQALNAALSATVGLGNIAGVAIAVSVGGPGAVFWMMMAALFGMTSKFAECTLGVMYRRVDANGNVQGGPMVYLRDGLAEIGLPRLGKYLSVTFAVLCIGGSFGGGNMFQSNQSFQAMTQLVPWFGGEHARGTVRLTSDVPHTYELRRHLVRFEVPESLRPEGTRASMVYLPVDDLRVSADDWTRESGRYVYEVPVRAADSGEGFDAPANTLTVMQVGQVEGRDVQWVAADNVEISNPAPVTGGVPNRAWLYGLALAALVGAVIIGGIRSIGNVASKIVPFMCGLYVVASLFIVVTHYAVIPHAVWTIINEAFNPAAGLGGAVGVFIQGVRRAAFSNEAGVGSAAIAHSAAKTGEPVREGFVALLEPFIDTIIVCFMTGIVVVITGVYADPATAGLQGVDLTAAAFESVVWWFPYVLSLAVILFAFSTMISWSYYGERCWTFLFGADQSMAYRAIFLVFVWLGAVSSLSNVLDFSDLMILSMAFPNILGAVLLSRKLHVALSSYWDRLTAGEFKTYR